MQPITPIYQLSLFIQNAIAVLNVSGFKLYPQSHCSHQKLEAFNVNAVKTPKSREQFYFLEGKLEFLDTAREWFFDRSANAIYLWVPGGGPPTGDIRVKVQDRTFTGSLCNNVTISGIDFFATTVDFNKSYNIRVENGSFSYPISTQAYAGRYKYCAFDH